jgi:hypothetical protein
VDDFARIMHRRAELVLDGEDKYAAFDEWMTKRKKEWEVGSRGSGNPASTSKTPDSCIGRVSMFPRMASLHVARSAIATNCRCRVPGSDH